MKTINRIVKNLLQNYTNVAKAYSVGVVTLTLVGGLTAGVSSSIADDDVPIRQAALEAVVEEVSISTEEEKKESSNVQAQRLVTFESPTEVKNQVAYRSDMSDPEVEMKVRAYYADAPVLILIAECESTFRQYGDSGNALRNRNSTATGVMQIMASLHESHAKSLGFDIHTLEGNLGFARVLYEKNGTRDWNASKSCWGPKQIAAGL